MTALACGIMGVPYRLLIADKGDKYHVPNMLPICHRCAILFDFRRRVIEAKSEALAIVSAVNFVV